AGHRNTHGEPFRYINRLEPGDPIVVETQDTYFVYKMTSILPVTSPSNISVLEPVPKGSGFTGPGRYITLTTCTPEFTSKYRMIVWGKMAEERPRSKGKPDALVNQGQGERGNDHRRHRTADRRTPVTAASGPPPHGSPRDRGQRLRRTAHHDATGPRPVRRLLAVVDERRRRPGGGQAGRQGARLLGPGDRRGRRRSRLLRQQGRHRLPARARDERRRDPRREGHVDEGPQRRRRRLLHRPRQGDAADVRQEGQLLARRAPGRPRGEVPRHPPDRQGRRDRLRDEGHLVRLQDLRGPP